MERLEILQEIFNGSWIPRSGFHRPAGGYDLSSAAVMDFVKQNQLNVGMCVVFIVLAIRQVVSKNKEANEKGANRRYLDAPDFPEVESLGKFEWEKEEPIKLRLFKPKYHLTMGEF